MGIHSMEKAPLTTGRVQNYSNILLDHKYQHQVFVSITVVRPEFECPTGILNGYFCFGQ